MLMTDNSNQHPSLWEGLGGLYRFWKRYIKKKKIKLPRKFR